MFVGPRPDNRFTGFSNQAVRDINRLSTRDFQQGTSTKPHTSSVGLPLTAPRAAAAGSIVAGDSAVSMPTLG